MARHVDPAKAKMQADQRTTSLQAVDAIASGMQQPLTDAVATQASRHPLESALVPLAASGRAYGQLAPEPTNTTPAGYNLWDFAKDSLKSESVSVNSIRALEEAAGYNVDPNFKLPDDNTPEFKRLTDGIPQEYWGSFGNALSDSHAQFIRSKILGEMDAQRNMQAYGGTAGILAANILNPENFAIGALSGGTAWASRGARLARALKAGGIAAAENMALEVPLQNMQETRDHWDVLYAAVGGIALGGAFGALGKGVHAEVKAGAADVARRDLDAVALHEAQSRGLLTEAQARRAELNSLETDIRTKAADARTAELAPQAKGALSRAGLEQSQRAVDTAKAHLDRVEAQLPAIEQRMLQEDITSMGEKLATSKHYSKLRRAAAKLEHNALAKGQRERFKQLQATHAEATTKAAARAEAASIADGTHPIHTQPARKALDFLQGDTKAHLGKKLEAARSGLRDALGLKRMAEQGKPIPTPTQGTGGAAAGNPAGFGADSHGAARVSPEYSSVIEDISPEHQMPKQLDEFNQTFRRTEVNVLGKRFNIGLPRWDIASVLRGVEHPEARAILGRYVGDGVGAAKGTNPIGASEMASRIFDTSKAKFHKAYEPGFGEWLKETKGLGKLGVLKARNDRALRKEFGQAVDHALRFGPEPGTTKAVENTAGQLSKIYNEFGARAKEAGVKGFEDFKADPHYAPRVLDFHRIGAHEERFGTARVREFVTEAIRSGFRKAGKEIDADMEKLITRMGEGYTKTLITKGRGVDASGFHGVRLGDIDQLAAILDEAGVSQLEKAAALQRIHGMITAKEGEGGQVRYSRQRTLLDEQHTARMWDAMAGEHVEVNFRDLFMQTDAEQLFENYSRSMSGHTALAEVVGIRSAKDHEKLLAKLADMIPDAKERTKISETLDGAYKLITGSPLDDAPQWVKNWRRVGRAMRDYNFLRVMNMVGFAQIPDSAAFLTPHYFKYARHYMPELHQFMKRAADGTLDHKLAQEMEELIATGTDYDNNNLFSAFDDEPLSKLSRLEHGLRVGNRVVSNISGLRHLTDFNQRLSGMAAANRLVSNIMGRTADMTEQRLLNLGLTKEKIARIKAQADKHVEFDAKKSGKLMALEVGKWDDPTAVHDFLGAAYREARRMVQEEDLGDTSLFMHTSLGKILFQFRRFPLVAYTQQFGHGIVHADSEVLARTGMQVALGSASYTAQMYLYSLSKPEEERAAFREKYLSPQAIFFGGIFRAGMFSLIPQVLTTVADTVTGGGASTNQARTTGLSSGIMGIPAIDLASRTFQLTQSVASSVFMGDKQFDQADFDNMRRLLPFQNAFVVKQLLDHMQYMLPKHDSDKEGNSDFGFRLDRKKN